MTTITTRLERQSIQANLDPQEDNQAAFGSKKTFAPAWEGKEVSLPPFLAPLRPGIRWL
jgi:hypothetical protein